MNIVKISAVLEGSYAGETFWRDDVASIYGLGDDNKMYYWGRTKTTRVEHEPDEDGDTSHDEHEYGWVPFKP